MPRTPQTAYETVSTALPPDTERLIHAAMYEYLVRSLGLPEQTAAQRAQVELENSIGREVCRYFEQIGIPFEGQVVLDLGAGLGGVAAALAERGAKVVAVEPGAGWREIAAARLRRSGGIGVMLGAVGEALPLADASIDLIVSLQVLEHVENPEAVIREAYRVLKGGGWLYFAYENYLGFREPHYRVRWLPLLPKSWGALYLRRIGRDPRFLLEAVTYTTFPNVRRFLADAGFVCARVEAFRQALVCPHRVGLKWRVLKALARITNAESTVGLLALQDYLRRMFRTAVYELVRKPV